MTERLSTLQYARKMSWSKQNVLYYIRKGKTLPGVERVEKIAGRNILHADLKKMQRMLQK